jgi:hypothetical protein
MKVEDCLQNHLLHNVSIPKRKTLYFLDIILCMESKYSKALNIYRQYRLYQFCMKMDIISPPFTRGDGVAGGKKYMQLHKETVLLLI